MQRLLVWLSQRADVRGDLGDGLAVLAAPADRASFLQLARELGIEGLVLGAIETSGLVGSLAAVVVREVNTRLDQLKRQALLWDLERDRVLHALNRHRITPLLLKGSALREHVYDEATDRSMGDLDLLVAPDEIDRSMAALREAGYRPESEQLQAAYREHHFHYVLNHPRGFVVELHWGLTQPGSAVPLDAKQFLARAMTSGRGANVPVRVPSPEDLLLHTVSQNEDDGFGLLRRIVDIDRIVARSPRLDWSYLARTARESHLDVVLRVSLRLASVLLRTDVPRELTGGAGLPMLSRLHLAMLDPAAWVVSLPSKRRAVACDTVRLWCAQSWNAWAHRVADTLRGAQTVAMVADDSGGSRRRPVAESTAVRAAKLGGYHLVLYWRSALALASESGRRRLQFWS